VKKIQTNVRCGFCNEVIDPVVLRKEVLLFKDPLKPQMATVHVSCAEMNGVKSLVKALYAAYTKKKNIKPDPRWILEF
jgi:hypothetical protein